MYETVEEWIDAELYPLLKGVAVEGDLREMSEEEALRAWTLLKFVEERVGARIAELRDRLLAEAEEFGKDTDKGGQRLYINRHLILREKRVSKLPEVTDFKVLMERANLSLDKAFTKKTTTVLDPSKIENLVNLGKLDEKDVEELRKVTWALRVKPDPDLEAVLDEIFGKGDEELPDVKPRAKRSTAEGNRKA